MLMPPNQYSPPPSAGPPSNYDFIFNPPQAPKKRFGLPSGNSTGQRIAIVSIGAFILLILFIILSSVLTSGSKTSTQTFINIAEEQAEIIRVATIGTQQSRGSDSKNLAMTVLLSMETTQQQTLALLTKNHHKLGTKQLAVKRNPQTDQALTSANLNNNFDEAFTQQMQTSLSTYRTDVKAAYDASKSNSEKQILSNSYTGISVLLANLPGNSQSNS